MLEVMGIKQFRIRPKYRDGGKQYSIQRRIDTTNSVQGRVTIFRNQNITNDRLTTLFYKSIEVIK